MRITRRAPVLVFVLAGLATLLAVDRDRPDSGGVEAGPPPAESFGLPVAAPTGALSSTWYCAGGTGEADEPFADHTVIVANATDAELEGTLTVHGGEIRQAVTGEEQLDEVQEAEETGEEGEEGEEAEEGEEQGGEDEDPAVAPGEVVIEDLSVPALGRVEIRLGDLLEAPLVSAVVELPGGYASVEHRVESVHGSDTAPCASNAAEEWHFAWGATTADARELLVFFNPFSDDAVIDGFFITDDGPREPSRFDGLVVPAGSVVGLDLGDDVTIRTQIAGSLRSSGRVVVDRIQRFDGSNGPRGLTVRLGMPEAKPLWIFPDGLVDEGVEERFLLYNPTESSAEVAIDISPDDPVDNGIPEPFDITVPPGAQVVVDVGEDGRIADGVAHSATVRVLNNSAVVAERLLVAGEPSGRSGISITSGSPVAAPAWLFAAGGTSSEQDEFIYIANPSNEFLATVDVIALANGQKLAIQGLTGIELPPAGRLALRLGSQIEREELPLIVESSSPIVAERGLYAAEGRGVSNAIGVPLPEGIEEPPPFIID